MLLGRRLRIVTVYKLCFWVKGQYIVLRFKHCIQKRSRAPSTYEQSSIEVQLQTYHLSTWKFTLVLLSIPPPVMRFMTRTSLAKKYGLYTSALNRKVEVL
ncbi:hypothetical protein Hdeb2414_s0019g00541871 [Helianthus debilis subsp. tardiflorus]